MNGNAPHASWQEYQKLVLHELQSLNERQDKLERRMWSLVVGYIPLVVTIIVQAVT